MQTVVKDSEGIYSSLEIDTFIHTGTSHDLCQDYILSGENPLPYVILADGCSTARCTDIGARLLCHGAKNALTCGNHSSRELLKCATLCSAELGLRYFKMPLSSLMATLMVSFVMQDIVYVYTFGDGYIITLTHTNDICFYEIQYTNNAPDYLAYDLDPGSASSYKSQNIKRTVILHRLIPNTQTPEMSRTSFELSDSTCNSFVFPLDTYKCVLVGSDGINSFVSFDQKISIQDVIENLTAFKNCTGAFLRRRCRRMIEVYRGERIHHSDDISVGGYYKDIDRGGLCTLI